jgi:hypothetical protein
MRETRISLPELGLVALTRAGLGFGIGLLASSRMTKEQRRAIGIAMVVVGAVTTVPLALEILKGRVRSTADDRTSSVEPGDKSAMAGARQAPSWSSDRAKT